MAKKKGASKPSPDQLREALLLLGEQDDLEGRVSHQVIARLVELGLLLWPEPDTVEFTEAGEAAFARIQRGESVPLLHGSKSRQPG
jgi:hypothetical protein